MNTERLLNVAKALRESKHPEKFSMKDFANPDCGTPMCALGHYASRTDLQSDFYLIDPKLRGSTVNSPLRAAVFGDDEPIGYDSRVVLRHFGIDYDAAEDLFGVAGCDDAMTPLAAAIYIERFVAEHQDADDR